MPFSGIILSIFIGVLTGLFYFGGLWLTVSKIALMKKRQWLAIVSFFIRLAVTVLIFALVVYYGSIYHLLISLLFFIIVKFTFVRVSKKKQS